MDIVNNVWPSWHIEKLIGQGSYGKVYRVFREDLGHKSYCAVKVINIPNDSSEIRELMSSGMDENSISTYYSDMVKQLMNEIKIMESLKSVGNIVSIEDFELVEKENGMAWEIFIRMELLISMNEYLSKHNMSEEETVNFGIDICEALKACESVRVIHRDIKMDNIFVNAFGKFKLGDFGIARQLEKTQSVLSQKGTGMYMAPEVYKGEEYNQTVDIYSLGIVMYRLLNKGRYPFMPVEKQISFGEREEALNKRMQGERLPNPVNADAYLSKILEKAYAFRSIDRYQAAEDFLIELKKYKETKIKTGNKGNDFKHSISEESTYNEDFKINRALEKTEYETEKTESVFSGKNVQGYAWSKAADRKTENSQDIANSTYRLVNKSVKNNDKDKATQTSTYYNQKANAHVFSIWNKERDIWLNLGIYFWSFMLTESLILVFPQAKIFEFIISVSFCFFGLAWIIYLLMGKKNTLIVRDLVDRTQNTNQYRKFRTITIGAPYHTEKGYQFLRWEVKEGNVKIKNANAIRTTVRMKGTDVILLAKYSKVN